MKFDLNSINACPTYPRDAVASSFIPATGLI